MIRLLLVFVLVWQLQAKSHIKTIGTASGIAINILNIRETAAKTKQVAKTTKKAVVKTVKKVIGK